MFGLISLGYSRIIEYGFIVINIEKLNGNMLLLIWSYFYKLFILMVKLVLEFVIVVMFLNYVWGVYVIVVL